MTPKLALIGDYSESVTAHRAIPRALELASAELGLPLEWHWLATSDLISPAEDLAGFSAVWVVPASPYANTEGVLQAIRWAREGGRPLLGTCGGFQHFLIEFARNVAGLTEADHAETNPSGRTLVVTALACPLVEATGPIRFRPGSRLARAYGATESSEGYRCRFGLDPAHAELLAERGLDYTAWDDQGAIRAAELRGHPFFVGTLFQPERRAFQGQVPPLVRAFVQATAAHCGTS